MKLKEIKQSIISKITTNQRNLIKGRSGSSGATDMELFVKIVKSCQLTGSKLILCGNYSTVYIFVINYHLNKPEKKNSRL